MTPRKKQIQAYLSVASMHMVESQRERFKVANMSESSAVNSLIERLIVLESEVIDLREELGTLQDNNQQEMREGGI